MKIINDVKDLFGTITFIDFIFFFAIIALLILIVILVHFIKINNEVLLNNRTIIKPKSDLEQINEELVNAANTVKFTNYEIEQEEKAIISYEELLRKKQPHELNYLEEKEIDGLSIKKINIDDMYSEKTPKNDIIETRVISYQKEEEFLKTLKVLKSLLN